MKKNCFYLIGIVVSLCLFASCSKSKDEPEQPYVVPNHLFELVGEEPNKNLTFDLNADAQVLTIVAHSDMSEFRVETGIDDFWIHYKGLVKKPEIEQVEFVFDIEANTTEAERVGYIYIGCPPEMDPMWGFYTKVIIVNQKQPTLY